MISKLCSEGDLVRVKPTELQVRESKRTSKPITMIPTYRENENGQMIPVRLPIGEYGVVTARTNSAREYLLVFPRLNLNNVYLVAQCLERIEDDLEAVS